MFMCLFSFVDIPPLLEVHMHATSAIHNPAPPPLDRKDRIWNHIKEEETPLADCAACVRRSLCNLFSNTTLYLFLVDMFRGDRGGGELHNTRGGPDNPSRFYLRYPELERESEEDALAAGE